ncbi:hypothetical protein CSUB01_07535 [Colletotrichum sublineola]|uniref:Myb-like domain-containing protein n=1 Tax=Colletotrichum sublineola TaxID=1173701 RepID=A0A066XDP7_COLSU|nr:hypothetical protein CSUB01_07535 [Colletotrichum sublineola]
MHGAALSAGPPRWQQQNQQPQFPSTALATGAEQDLRIPSATEAKTTSRTTPDPFASTANLELDFGENTGVAECDFASLKPLARSCEVCGILSTRPKPAFSDDISSYPQCRLSGAPVSARPFTEQAPYNATNPSSAEELPLALDLARQATEQLRLANSVISGINSSVVEVEGSSKSSESFDIVQTSDDSGFDDAETNIESCHQEMAAIGSEITEQDMPGSPVLHVLTESNSAASNYLKSPSVSRDTCLNDPSGPPVGCLGGPRVPQMGGFSLSTSTPDHAFESEQDGQVVTHRRKRGFITAASGCEDRSLRSAKRMRYQGVDTGTKSPALPTRTLRALPSRVPAENPSNKVSNEIETQPRRPAGTEECLEAGGLIGSVHCGKDMVRPNGLLMPGLDNPPGRSRCKEPLRDRSPTSLNGPSLRRNHLPKTERCGFVSPRGITTTINPTAATCHTCGFSAEHLLRMIDTFEALDGVSAKLPDDKRRMDMLVLFLGFIKNYAMESLSYNETSTGKPTTSNARHQGHAAETAVRLSGSDAFNHDDGPHDNTGDNNDCQSDNQSNGDSSDQHSSPDSIRGKFKRSKRRRWTDLEEKRLHEYIKSGKKWSWIAKKLRRSEAAVTQHWVLMGRQSRETAK